MKVFKVNKFYDAPEPEGGAQGGGHIDPASQPFDPINNPFGNQDLNGNQNKPPEGKKPEGSQENPNEYKVPSYWEKLGERLSTTENPYEMPDSIRTGIVDEKPISEDEIFNSFVTEIQKNTRIPELEDPFISEYIRDKRSRGEDFDVNKYVAGYKNEVSLQNLNDKDYMIQSYKTEFGKSDTNPEGMTDDEIIEEVDTLNRITLARERKNREADSQAKLESSRIKLEGERKVIRDNEINSRRQNDALTLAKLEGKFLKTPTVNGINIGESEMKNAIEEFKVLNEIDENGNKGLSQLFSTDEAIFKAYLLLRKDGEYMKGLFSGLKSEAAQDILSRTSVNPSDPNYQGPTGHNLPSADDFMEKF